MVAGKKARAELPRGNGRRTVNRETEALLSDFLSGLERSEAALLTWGLVDGFSTRAELLGRADDFLNERQAWEHFQDGPDLLDAMEERRLLFRWRVGNNDRYRTRLGEALRLLARLRQLFPSHLAQPGAWLTSATLVADFRLMLRPRQYPARDLPAVGVIDRCMAAPAPALPLTELQREAMQTMLGLADGVAGLDIAGFQDRATRRILRLTGTGTAGGTVVCAGTGSGKTLAFYLPALTHLAGMIERDATYWVRALALYPRNELLKDQFTETCRMTRKVNAVLRARNRRPMRIGALFGSTPKTADDAVRSNSNSPKDWAVAGGGCVCPFLRCPVDDCAGQMVWRDEDRTAERERLVCDRCGTVVGEDEIVLTRKRLNREPPDILFTTTEMLNRRMTDSQQWRLFGIGQPVAKRPALMLLDEVHTYGGIHGAQVACLLRRWRHRTRGAPHFVGLSATLMEAAAFFARLTGLPARDVEEVAPEPAEMVQQGVEYLVAVRGDPVSGASLLSTTIQTAMLLRRVLDLNADGVSHGNYGSKVFVFTDDLDVTNRLYFNLLDAEGMNRRGEPNRSRHPGGSLAALRDSTRPDAGRRQLYGQSWKLCEDIGHSLRGNTYLRLGRVSSQDAGVDASAELIVATASLEVGFNDPEVGAVLQHKSPHEAATFLQRKGRAGRRREMRPWTVVVLSDYGRDRLSYQGYDLLFDPELRPRDLPLSNRHVLKMQAAYACLDWLSEQMPSSLPGQVWADASAPWGNVRPQFWREFVRDRQKKGAEILTEVLEGGESLDRLQEFLRRALALPNPEEVSAVLWEAPRALMTSVLPTLLRRWETQWLSGSMIGAEYHVRQHPLPEFVPASLFSDLNLPEVTIWAVTRPGQEPEAFPLPAAQALREFAPGRISRRLGYWSRAIRHWLPVDPAAPPEQDVEIDPFCGTHEREALGTFRYAEEDGTTATILALRPFALHVRHDAPEAIVDSSNAFLKWRTQILPPFGGGAGYAADLPARSAWRGVLEEIRFFTHRQHEPARIRRFALGSRANVRLPQNEEKEITARFVAADAEGTRVPVALGFAFESDALRVRVRFPTDWRFSDTGISPAKLPALRAAYFRWCVLRHEDLASMANVFQRQWIADIVLAATTAAAIAGGTSIEQAWTSLRLGESEVALSSVLDVIFQSVTAEATGDLDADTRLEQRRQVELNALLTKEEVLAILDDLAPLLWRPPDASWTEWLNSKFLATVGAAFRDAIQQLCPDVDADDLIVDLDAGPPEPGEEGDLPPTGYADIWISETAPGGGGVIERLLPRLGEDPHRFLDLLRGALNESDYESADRELGRFLGWVTTSTDSELLALVAAVRTPVSQVQLAAAFQDLRASLKDRGLQTSHAVIAALASRLLRPGSTPDTDALVHNALLQWTAEEARLGVEIEARTLAFALSASDVLDQALDTLLPLGPNQELQQWRFNALYGVLWPRGAQARNQALSLYNPYAVIPIVERFLVVDALPVTEPEIAFESADWPSALETALIAEARAVLACQTDVLGAFRRGLLRLLTTPVDTGVLLLHPRLRAVLRQDGRVRARLELVSPGQIAAAPPEPGYVPGTARLIVRTMNGSRDDVRDLLESLFAAEMLAPSEQLWLVSPWISDLPVLDNRAGAYAGLEPSWPKRHLTLAELFAFALKSAPHCHVRIVTRPDPRNARFCERLRTLADLDGSTSRLNIENNRETLHIKGLAGSNFVLKGSMNFTHNGVEVLEEVVELEIDPARVSALLLNFVTHYPVPA